MILEQERLDAITKKRSNLFNWRGQFTPEFVEYILKSFSNKGDSIIDPFSGSGTVLQESASLGLKAKGFEINPSAYAMSKFFSFCNSSNDERNYFINSFEKKLNLHLLALNGQKLYLDKKDYREAYFNLLEFAKQFNQDIDSIEERVFFLNMLFISEKDKKNTVKDSISKSFQSLKKSLYNLPHSEVLVDAYLEDARLVGKELTNSADLILTSPPYINVFNYHQNYRAIIETFHFDILKVAHSEFGSNRKNRGNRFKTVIQYCIDMELAIKSFWNALKLNGKMILVVGRESNVRGVPFYNGQLVVEIIDKTNGFIIIEILERQFMNKFGVNIKEDIIIALKKENLNANLSGRSIAVSHLQKSLEKSSEEIFKDIKEAIENSEEIEQSPIFNPLNIISK